MNENLATVGPMKSEAGVDKALGGLEYQIAEAEEQLTHLIDKLGPFLTSEPTLPTSEPELDPDADGSNLRVRLVRATRTLSVLTDNMRVTMHRVDR